MATMTFSFSIGTGKISTACHAMSETVFSTYVRTTACSTLSFVETPIELTTLKEVISTLSEVIGAEGFTTCLTIVSS